MTRQQWIESNRALRHLLKDLSFDRRRRLSSNMVQYKFGAVYDQRIGIWYIYNGMTDNVIAALKKTGNSLTIRYRPNSIYAMIFQNRTEGWGHFRIRRVPSTNLGRNRSMARTNLRDIVQRAIQEHRQARDNPQTALQSDNNESFIQYLVDRTREFLLSGLSAPDEVREGYLDMVDRWQEDVIAGTFQGAWANLNERLDGANVSQAARSWARVFNPVSLGFATASLDFQQQQPQPRNGHNQLNGGGYITYGYGTDVSIAPTPEYLTQSMQDAQEQINMVTRNAREYSRSDFRWHTGGEVD